MIKRFYKNYVWYWKMSFDYMEGYHKFYTFIGCLFKAIPFCIRCEVNKER
jgi:hypothetical protein